MAWRDGYGKSPSLLCVGGAVVPSVEGSVREREVLVDGPHRGRSLANGCGNALHRACPDIANGE